MNLCTDGPYPVNHSKNKAVDKVFFIVFIFLFLFVYSANISIYYRTQALFNPFDCTGTVEKKCFYVCIDGQN